MHVGRCCSNLSELKWIDMSCFIDNAQPQKQQAISAHKLTIGYFAILQLMASSEIVLKPSRTEEGQYVLLQ